MFYSYERRFPVRFAVTARFVALLERTISGRGIHALPNHEERQKFMSTERPQLELGALRAVCAYAVAHVMLPDDVIRVSAGLRSKELL